MLPPDTTLISVDAHIVEPPQLWEDRLPAAMREAGPRVVKDNDGADIWLYQGRPYPQGGLGAIVGKDVKDWHRRPIRYDDIRPGCYDPKARLSDMDIDGVGIEINSPTVPRIGGTLFVTEGGDRDLALACVQAYNDFVFDEWCAADPDRLLPMVILPFWDVPLAVAELERTAAMGAKMVSFIESPSRLGLPSFHTDHWDPLFAAATDANLPLSLHFGSCGTPFLSPDAPYVVMQSTIGQTSMSTLADLVFSPVVHRFPDIKFVLSESGIGWIPYMLERLDQMWSEHRHYQPINFDARPSDLYRRNFWGCTILTEAFGLSVWADVGADRILIESDYPHADSRWPHTRHRAEELLADVPDHVARQIAELNARSVLNLPACS